MTIATLMLAAGGSTRLGQAKQLIRADGITLVRRMTDIAISLQTGPVLVVLGAKQEQIQAELRELSVEFIVNPTWQEGLASSIRAGLNALPNSQIDSFLILLTDQPFVTADLLRQLISTQQQNQKGIVACRYGEAGHLGVPALFAMRYKPDFMELSGDVGARKLIQQHRNDCAEVLFPLGAVDLDTPDDVLHWQSSHSSLPLP